MYSVILVTLWFIFVFYNKYARKILDDMQRKQDFMGVFVVGTIVNGLQGLTLGYSIWYVIYYLTEYIVMVM